MCYTVFPSRRAGAQGKPLGEGIFRSEVFFDASLPSSPCPGLLANRNVEHTFLTCPCRNDDARYDPGWRGSIQRFKIDCLPAGSQPPFPFRTTQRASAPVGSSALHSTGKQPLTGRTEGYTPFCLLCAQRALKILRSFRPCLVDTPVRSTGGTAKRARQKTSPDGVHVLTWCPSRRVVPSSRGAPDDEACFMDLDGSILGITDFSAEEAPRACYCVRVASVLGLSFCRWRGNPQFAGRCTASHQENLLAAEHVEMLPFPLRAQISFLIAWPCFLRGCDEPCDLRETKEGRAASRPPLSCTARARVTCRFRSSWSPFGAHFFPSPRPSRQHTRSNGMTLVAQREACGQEDEAGEQRWGRYG